MPRLILQNAQVISPIDEFKANLLISDGFIQSIDPVNSLIVCDNTPIIDCENFYVTPGLIDLQFNGNNICNLWTKPNQADFVRMCEDLARNGCTSFLPTLITDEIINLEQGIDFLAHYCLDSLKVFNDKVCNRILGIHLEGPFISKDRCGVHPHEFILKPSLDIAQRLCRQANIKIMTIACEEDPELSVTKFLQSIGVTVSLGHSNASLGNANWAFSHGVNLVTHLFNAMPSIHHRNPGLVTAALLAQNVTCALIPDGLHLDKNIIKLVIKTKGINNVILVTDCATVGTSGGGLVGSSITLSQGVRNLVEWNICSFQQAIMMASYNCAKVLNNLDYIGVIAQGKCADLILWDKANLEIKAVVINGQIV